MSRCRKSADLDCWEITLQLYFIRALFYMLLWAAVKLSVLLIGMAGALPVAELFCQAWMSRSPPASVYLLLKLKTCCTHPDCFHMFHVLWSQALSFIPLCWAAQWLEFMLDAAYINAVLSLAKACDLLVGLVLLNAVAFFFNSRYCISTVWKKKKTLISLAMSRR